MDKSLLRQLLRAEHWTVEELEQRNPQLARQVTEAIAASRRRLVEAATAELPDVVRARIANLDIRTDVRSRIRTALRSEEVAPALVEAVNDRLAGLPVVELAPGSHLNAEPAIAEKLAAARVYAIAEIAGLDAGADDELAKSVPSPSGLDEPTLAQLVGSHVLTHDQASSIGTSTALFTLTDGNIALATAIRTASFPSLGGTPPNVASLAALDVGDWAGFLEANMRLVPDGVDLASFANALEGRFTKVSPARAFASRFPAAEAREIVASLVAIEPLYARNRRVVDVEFAALDITDVVPDRLDAVRARHAMLSVLAKAYAGLEVATVLDDTTRSREERASTVARRVGLLREVVARLGETFVLSLDLSRREARVRPLLRDALQATEAEAELVLSTLRAYQRAWTVALDVNVAHSLVSRGLTSAFAIATLSSRTLAMRTGLSVEQADTIWQRARRSLADVALTAGAILDIAHDVRGTTPSTITSPSAVGELAQLAGYEELFGNLAFCSCTDCQSILGPAAYFVDLMKYIDDHLRSGFAQPEHPLDLKVRRPDLWTLPLTCSNTNDRVPTLDLVAEILENYIARHLGYAGDLSDRSAIEALVYDANLAVASDAVDQPFVLPLTRLDALLSAGATSRAEIVRVVGGTDAELVRAVLHVNTRGFDLIATEISGLAALGSVYGIAFGGTEAAVDPVDASALRAGLQIERAALGELVRSDFVSRGAVSIVPGKRDANSVQNDIERVTGLSAPVLDRMYRVVRLSRALRWNVPDVDLALASLGATELDEATLGSLSALVVLKARLDATTDQLRDLASTSSSERARRGLLAQLIHTTVEEVDDLAGLAGLSSTSNVGELDRVVTTHDQWRASHRSFDEIDVVLGKAPREPARYVDPARLAADAIAASTPSSAFAATIFAVALGVSESASRDIINANSASFVATATGWRLADDIRIDAATFTIPSSAVIPISESEFRPATVADIREVLREYDPSELLIRTYARGFDLHVDKLRALMIAAGQLPLSPATLAILRGETPATSLLEEIEVLRRMALAFKHTAWDKAGIELARSHGDRFGVTSLTQFDFAQLRRLDAYTTMAQPGLEVDARDVLLGYDGSAFAPSVEPQLVRVLNVPAALVADLRVGLPLPPIAMDALTRFRDATQLAIATGLSGAGLIAAATETFGSLQDAADEMTGNAAPTTLESIRESKRDSLASWLIHSLQPAIWNTTEDLSEHFLVDVSAGGCASTSRVVAGTTSAQTYVHRALLNLEAEMPRIPPEAAAEWNWRKNYRVWQANRTVFLWPENLLEPDLRDDKTPLFRELEDELLQTDITDQNVLDAYTKYLTGFEELATLTLAGAYHQIADETDVLHLFGVSANDPPSYYYRTCENLKASGRDPAKAVVWSAWQKMSVQISGRKVSPIVHRGRLHVFWTDVKTRSLSRIANGASEFAGYSHTYTLRFTTLRPDGAWTPPQTIQLGFDKPFGPSRGQVVDPIITESGPGPASLDPNKRAHGEPLDDYSLTGPNWDWCWLQSHSGGLRIQFRDFLERTELDLFTRRTISTPLPGAPAPYPQLLCARNEARSRVLYAGTPWWMFWPITGFANALIDESRIDILDLEGTFKGFFLLERFTTPIATLPVDAHFLATPGCETSPLIQVGSDLFYVDGEERVDGGYVLHRLGTTLVDSIARSLFEDGLDKVLDTRTQLALAEGGIPITPSGDRLEDRSNRGRLDFAGPYGVYYRELYFHIPYLIANALNSRGRFEAARRWYHYIFDPTSTEVIDVSGLPPEEAAHRALDRVWRYRELRGLDVEHLRAALSDPTAIERYRRDPFNPWAIARRRPAAIQKAIVIRYVRNLLDWADSLFAQFTMESVSEAQLLYSTASSVLGRRPDELGDCGAQIGTGDAATYAGIAPRLVNGDLLIELESWMHGLRATNRPVHVEPPTTYTVSAAAIRAAVAPSADALDRFEVLAEVDSPPEARDEGVFRGLGWRSTRTASWGPALGNATTKTPDGMGGRAFEHAWQPGFAASGFGWSVLQGVPVFCVPPNAQLLGLWQRVEDRLFKIRHCQDIDGRARELALFAPPLDAADLVAMEAGGLGLEDVIGAGQGALPPYRFAYLVERAKAFAGMLSALGNALLSAFERKDGEHLNRVRATQQINLSQMQTQAIRLEKRAAELAFESIDHQLTAAIYRRDYYAGLLAAGRSGWETAESVGRHAASAIHAAASALGFAGAMASLLADIGSPFAMKYGGVALGSAGARVGTFTGMLATQAESIAASAGLEGQFARRADGWRHQKLLADHDVRSLQRQVEAAQLRVDLADRSLVAQERSHEYLEVFELLADTRFTNIGRYTWLSSRMRTLYRDAYRNALAVAKLAERAFYFERGDDSLPGLAATYWTAEHGGLLAGDAMLVDLQTLERRFLETNYRTLEVDQTFALSQIDSTALLALRETGTCSFTIDEAFFDLHYPGHFKRRIKSARLTIPCITGPYVNVGATLELEESWMRTVGTPRAPLTSVPPSRSVTIATSTAQNDAGVFELSFRDERYMPFEGMGAISRWRLSLPSTFRQFDYQTISDVILAISYTSELDAALQSHVVEVNAALEGTIIHHFTTHPTPRVFSLRQDFASTFSRLLRSPAGTPLRFEITDRSLPLVFVGRDVRVTRGRVLLRCAANASVTGFALAIDGATIGAFAVTDLGGLLAADLPPAFLNALRSQHTIVVADAGGLAPDTSVPGDIGVVDPAKLHDIQLHLEIGLA
jgi:hypothetical protein